MTLTSAPADEDPSMTQIIWDNDGLGGRLAAWVRTRFAALLRGRRPNPKAAIPLATAAVFRTRFHAAGLSRGDRKKALRFALPDLMPVDPDHLLVFARTSAQGDAVELAALKTEDVTTGVRGAARFRLSDDWAPLTPHGRKASQRRTQIGALAVLALLAVALFGLHHARGVAENHLAASLGTEADVRREAVAALAGRRDAAVWTVLERDDLASRHPGRVLQTIARLNAATPDDAYWRDLEWSADVVRLKGRAREALSVAEGLRQADGVARVGFAAPIVTGEDGIMEFDVRVDLEKWP